MYKTYETINITYFNYPLIPGDNVWSDDGKVFCLFPSAHKAIHVGYLENLEMYPGVIYWDLVTSGNGNEIKAKMKEQSNESK